MAVDPDGRKIKVFYHDSDGKRQKVVIKDWEKRNEVLGKISNVFVQNVKEAFDYLDEYDKASGNNILSKIAGSNRSVKIGRAKREGIDQYNRLTNKVEWDPYSGLEAFGESGTKVDPKTDQVYDVRNPIPKDASQTPAMGLYGEMIHGSMDLFNKIASFVHGMIPDNSWGDKEEKVANEIEGNVSKLSAKEAVRVRHDDLPKDVDCPTCN